MEILTKAEAVKKSIDDGLAPAIALINDELTKATTVAYLENTTHENHFIGVYVPHMTVAETAALKTALEAKEWKSVKFDVQAKNTLVLFHTKEITETTPPEGGEGGEGDTGGDQG